MDENYLLKYISQKLQTCITRYSDQESATVICDNLDLLQEYHPVHTAIDQSLVELASTSMPKIVKINNWLSYGLIKSDNSIIIIGPIKTSRLTKVKLQIESDDIVKINQLLIPFQEFEKILDYTALLHNLYHAKKVSQIEVSSYNLEISSEGIKNLLANQLFTYREENRHHNSYHQEVRELKSIEEGNLDKLKKSWEEVYSGQIGRLAKNIIRNYKNLAIVVITTSSRAAMRGGADPEVCFSLSDNSIMAVEELSHVEEITNHIRQVQVEYTLLVKKAQKKDRKEAHQNQPFEHPFVTKSKTYITNHLHQTIELTEIAEMIPCSVSYLTKLFKSHTGLTIQQYIASEKMQYAEQLLIYTDKSITDIAATLGL